MKRYILLVCCLVVMLGCGSGGDMGAPSGSVIIIEGAKDGITSNGTSAQIEQISQTLRIAVKDSLSADALPVRDVKFFVTFEYNSPPDQNIFPDLAGVVTLCDGTRIINDQVELQTDGKGIYNLCVAYLTGGGLVYKGNIKITSNGAIATTLLTVTSEGQTALAVSPSVEQTVPAGSSAQFTITGGAPSYTITSSYPSAPAVPSVVARSGDTFIVTVPSGTPMDITLSYTITDSAGKTTLATVKVGPPQDLNVFPSEPTGTAGGTVQFTITGGTPFYTITSSDPSIVPSPSTVTANGGTFKVTVPAGRPDGTIVTFTVRDSVGGVKDVRLTIKAEPLDVLPSALTVVAGSSANFTILGGVPGYNVISDNASFPPSPSFVTASGGKFTVFTPTSIDTTTTVTFTVIDSSGSSTGRKTVTLTVTPAPEPLNVFPAGPVTVTPGNSVSFTVFDGTPPYTIASNNSTITPVPASVTSRGGTFSVLVPLTTPASTTVVFSVRDADGAIVTVSIITPP